MVCLATGANPGNTGVYDFRNRRDRDSLSFEPISSQRMQGKALWDSFSEAGFRVCVFNYPMLYPAYPTNGIMISKLMSPQEGSITYPPELRADLDRLTDGYAFQVPFNDPSYAGKEHAVASEFTHLLHKHAIETKKLLSQEPWDLFIGVIGVTDMVQHYLWKHWDRDHSQYSPSSSPSFRKLFVEIWHEVDELVGDIWKHLGKESFLYIISDHGFGALTQTFHVNEWLDQKGYLTWKSSSMGALNALSRSMSVNFPWLIKFIPQRLRNSNATKFSRIDIQELIDFVSSIAFMPSVSDIYGQIYINRKQSGSYGSSEYHRVVEEIINSLSSWPKEVGLDLSIVIYKSSDLYRGAYLELAPDIVFIVNNYQCRVTAQRGSPIYMTGSGTPNRSGTYRMHGILIGNGPELPKGQIADAQIIDLAPTILYLAGLPIPHYMDGEINFDILPPSAVERPPHFGSRASGPSDSSESGAYPDRDNDVELLQRLKDLGYV
ncbi:MAG: alkaline phosphatase family protein [Anaerolineaceae bacterium]|nr:alkaline phosphatase family protein [Anaerolineaceae bacterium]